MVMRTPCRDHSDHSKPDLLFHVFWANFWANFWVTGILVQRFNITLLCLLLCLPQTTLPSPKRAALNIHFLGQLTRKTNYPGLCRVNFLGQSI